MPDADERLLVEAANVTRRDSPRSTSGILNGVCVRRASRPQSDVAEDVTSEVFHKALAGCAGTSGRRPVRRVADSDSANAVIDRSKRAAREVVDTDRLPRDHRSRADGLLVDQWRSCSV